MNDDAPTSTSDVPEKLTFSRKTKDLTVLDSFCNPRLENVNTGILLANLF